MKSPTIRTVASALMLCIMVSGCASGQREIGGAPDLTVIDATELPPPTEIDPITGRIPQFLGPSDVLVVTVAGIEWLTDQEVRIDASGQISFPLAGAVEVAGMTPRDVETVLRDRLMERGRMVDPKVAVNVKEAPSRTITIEGEVRQPGNYEVSTQMTLLKSIAMAQGTAELAKLNDVVIFRNVGGQQYAALYDLQAIRHGAYDDPEVYPNDVVMVGDERGRRLFREILQIVPAITSPLIIALDRFSN